MEYVLSFICVYQVVKVVEWTVLHLNIQFSYFAIQCTSYEYFCRRSLEISQL